MPPIFLIGFMCSGKTTLGRAVAAAANLKFIDLDDEVERIAGITISEIFKTKGEAAFRQMEAAALLECSKLNNAIIACGGGTPCRPGAMQLMNQKGKTIWLIPDQNVLVERLLAGRAHRPLIKDLDTPEEMAGFVNQAMSKRHQYYALAKEKFDSSRLENQKQVSDSTSLFIERFCSNFKIAPTI